VDRVDLKRTGNRSVSVNAAAQDDALQHDCRRDGAPPDVFSGGINGLSRCNLSARDRADCFSRCPFPAPGVEENVSSAACCATAESAMRANARDLRRVDLR
jgi:hypothetical protein